MLQLGTLSGEGGPCTCPYPLTSTTHKLRLQQGHPNPATAKTNHMPQCQHGSSTGPPKLRCSPSLAGLSGSCTFDCRPFSQVDVFLELHLHLHRTFPHLA